MTYKTFMRSARNWGEFSKARKTTIDRGLTLDEARRACKRFNTNRTSTEVALGTKMEFQGDGES